MKEKNPGTSPHRQVLVAELVLLGQTFLKEGQPLLALDCAVKALRLDATSAASRTLITRATRKTGALPDPARASQHLQRRRQQLLDAIADDPCLREIVGWGAVPIFPEAPPPLAEPDLDSPRRELARALAGEVDRVIFERTRTEICTREVPPPIEVTDLLSAIHAVAHQKVQQPRPGPGGSHGPHLTRN